MTYKSIIQILLILAIISTICISIIKPKMHEPVMVLNSQFSVEQEDSTKIDEKDIAILVQDSEIKQDGNVSVENSGGINFVEPKIEDIEPINIGKTETQSNNIGIQNKKTQNITNSGIKNNNNTIKTTPVKTNNNTVKPVQAKVNPQPIKNNNKPALTTSQTPKIDLNKIVNNNNQIINTPTQNTNTSVKNNNIPSNNTPVTSIPKVVQTNPPKQNEPKTQSTTVSQSTTQTPKTLSTKTESQPVVLTAAQEEIAWNKWRSNLNNQIMKDSKLPTMPNGIIFKYKFTVDKYGKVSNVQTSSTTPGYTPYAIQFIAPVIRSYQGRAILNFPAGSKREYTEVSGAWKISNSSKLSTPDDYNDIEKIKR